jgi:hypothetical protein
MLRTEPALLSAFLEKNLLTKGSRASVQSSHAARVLDYHQRAGFDDSAFNMQSSSGDPNPTEDDAIDRKHSARRQTLP